MVRHGTDACSERGWFRNVMAAQRVPMRCTSAADPDGDFDGAVPDPDVVAHAWEAWRAEIELGDHVVTGAPDLDVTGDEPWRGPMSLCWVLVHLIEEYARHNGHADLLREQIDGAAGQ